MVSKATSEALSAGKAKAAKAKPVLTPEAEVKSLKKELKEVKMEAKALKEGYDSLRETLEAAPKPPSLSDYLATVDLCLFDEATAALIQRLQKRLANI